MKSSQFKVALIGEVDAGKSTTLGQILMQTNSVMPSKLQEVLKVSELQNKEFEPAFLLDSIEQERSLEMTIDITTTKCIFGDEIISFLDTPGHQHLSSKFIGGAADVDLAILILDAQTVLDANKFRHLEMLRKIGLQNFAILVNKLDLLRMEAHFYEFTNQIQNYVGSFQKEICYLAPIDSKKGLGFSKNDFNWFSGNCLFDVLKNKAKSNEKKSQLFCLYNEIGRKNYWLNCYSGNISDSNSLYVGNIKLKSVTFDGYESNETRIAPWIVQGIMTSDLKIPDSGFFCGTKNSSHFVNEFKSDLVEFTHLESGEYLFRNFWSTCLCVVSKSKSEDLFSIKLAAPIQFYNLNNRFNLFCLYKNTKMQAIGIPN